MDRKSNPEHTRRLMLGTMGSFLGGVQLISSKAKAKMKAQKLSIQTPSSEREKEIQNEALSSEEFKAIDKKLQQRELSVSSEHAKSYSVETNAGGYSVASFYPTYPSQGTISPGTNIALRHCLVKDCFSWRLSIK